MKFNYLRSPLLFALLLMPLNSHCREQGSKETQGLELGGLLSSIDSALEGVAEELSSLESTIVKDTESLESMLARYRASIYLRLQCETPDTRSSDPAVVRATHPFEEEYACLSERRKKAHAALEGLFGQQIPKDQLPVIAFCGSGGGVRAQFETLGWLRAAERLKILPTLQYVSGLSGSTWALTPWIASKMSVQDYSKQCVPRLTKTIQEHLAELTLHDRKDLFYGTCPQLL